MTRERTIARYRAWSGASAPAPAPTPAPPFSPAAITYTTGVWFDQSDLATGYTDSAGTIPQTVSGEVTGRRLDKSGNALHLTQASVGLRPIYTVGGAIQWDEYDAADDWNATPTATFGADMDVFMLVYRDTSATMVLGYVNGKTTHFFGGCDSGSVSQHITANGGAAWTTLVDGLAVGTTAACSRQALNTALSPLSWHVLQINNISMSDVGWSNLAFGSYNPTFRLDGRIGGVIVCPAQSSGIRDQLRTWLGAKGGLTL